MGLIALVFSAHIFRLVVHPKVTEDPAVWIVFVVEGLCSCEMFLVCKHKVHIFLIEVGLMFIRAMVMKTAVFWDVAPCSLVEMYRRRPGFCCHYRLP
jgi:hypothetical protein